MFVYGIKEYTKIYSNRELSLIFWDYFLTLSIKELSFLKFIIKFIKIGLGMEFISKALALHLEGPGLTPQ